MNDGGLCIFIYIGTGGDEDFQDSDGISAHGWLLSAELPVYSYDFLHRCLSTR